MLLAAGRGERMRELTANVPKPLLEAGGMTLIERQMRLLGVAGFTELVVNLSYRAEQIRRHVSEAAGRAMRVEFVDEGEPALETGGGILNALPLLGPAPFAVVNADIVSDYDFARLLSYERRGKLVLVPNPPHHRGGDFGIDAEGLATLAPPLETFAGISVLDPAIFRGFAPGRQPLKPILDAAIRKAELTAEIHAGVWLDVGTSERLRAADAWLSGG